MKKNLVLTIAIGQEYKNIAELTNKSIKKYADKIGADFYCITEKAISKTTPHWEKFQIFNFLEIYDRILYLDSDIIIRSDCPNLFDIVPETQLGMFNEGQFTDRSKEMMISICKEYNVVLDYWDGRYFNSGVMVISKFHKSLFKKPEKEIFNFYEQSYINMMIAKREIEMFELEHYFNRMTCVDRYTGEERHQSYIIHYAGYPNLIDVLHLIKNDLDKWEKDYPNYNYKKHLYVSVSGGIGDQICAEPVIRWMRNNLYPNDDFIVATHYPTFFKHLDIEVIEHGKANLKNDTPYFIAESLPGPETINWMVVSHLLCHSVDYISISLMKRTLPLLDKTIKFTLNDEIYSSLYEKLKIKENELKDYIIIHPGKHWNSKTFPIEYWQEIIDGLGDKIILIGKEQQGDAPFYKEGARGTVDVVCKKGIDARNLLNIDEVAALISIGKILISNDSFPIHLAGAFDNWIILLPSCKHPDHVLPYRNGNIFYKTKSFYKKLIIDEIESRPTQLYETSAEIENIEWTNYLIDPKIIITEIKKL